MPREDLPIFRHSVLHYAFVSPDIIYVVLHRRIVTYIQYMPKEERMHLAKGPNVTMMMLFPKS
jgi:hypothetical protein